MRYLLVIDMQNDFIDGALGTAEAVAIVPLVAQKIAQRRAEGFQVIFTRDTHAENYLLTQEGRKLPVVHCLRGTHGWQITDKLPVASGDQIVDKVTFGAFALPQYLHEPEEIELVGLCTDICVISNAMLLKAAFPETELSVDAACCAGVSPECHRNALNAMKMCQISIENE